MQYAYKMENERIVCVCVCMYLVNEYNNIVYTIRAYGGMNCSVCVLCMLYVVPCV